MGNGESSNKVNRTLLETMGDHEESINCLTLSEDESMLVSGSEDGTARMWSTKTSETECLGVLRGHSSYINCVGITDTIVVTGSADSTIRKWDMTTCECLFVYEGHEARIQKLIVTADFIFSSSYDKTARCWFMDTSDMEENNEDSACAQIFRGHSNGVYPLIYIPSQTADIENNRKKREIIPGDILITGSADTTARSWSIDSGSSLRGHVGTVTTMSTDVNGKILYTAGSDSSIKSWNIHTGQCFRTMEGHKNSVICMFITNRLMYTGSADSTAKCWVTEFGDCTRTYRGHKQSVICIKFSKGILFTGSGDGIVRAFDAKSGVLKRTFIGHENAINSLAIVDEKLYTGSSDGTLRVWDASEIIKTINLEEGYEREEDTASVKSEKSPEGSRVEISIEEE